MMKRMNVGGKDGGRKKSNSVFLKIKKKILRSSQGYWSILNLFVCKIIVKHDTLNIYLSSVP